MVDSERDASPQPHDSHLVSFQKTNKIKKQNEIKKNYKKNEKIKINKMKTK